MIALELSLSGITAAGDHVFGASDHKPDGLVRGGQTGALDRLGCFQWFEHDIDVQPVPLTILARPTPHRVLQDRTRRFARDSGGQSCGRKLCIGRFLLSTVGRVLGPSDESE